MDKEQAARLIENLVQLMLEKQGSDLFIIAGSPPAVVIDGEVNRIGLNKLDPSQTETLVRSVLTERQWLQFEQKNELNFALHYPNLARFRVNVLRQRGSAAMVLRLIPSYIPTFDELHLPPILKDVTMAQRGLVVFLGGTSCGKSTSLAAMIDYRSRQVAEHIITIEDPIEFFYPHRKSLVTQREVGVDTESYAVALKNALRQRPNVVLIGEIRDSETMEHALNFAESGHLCLTTLHANTTDQAFDRIVNFFPEERRPQVLMDLSFNMRAFICQRLLPRCDQPGLIPAVEVLTHTPFLSKLIFQGRIPEIKPYMNKASEPGFQTFDQSLFQLYEAGFIDYEMALRHSDSQNDMRIQIKLKSQRPLPEELRSSTAELSVELPPDPYGIR